MAGPGPIVADLRAESDDLDALVAPLPPQRWAEPTPAPGWTIAHQIGHLLWTDRVALTAVTDEAGFADVLTQAAADPAGFVDAGAEELAARPPGELLDDWRMTRGRLHDALLTVADGRKLPWFGPPMSAASMATARLMETWAHGLDVADALGISRPATNRLRSIAHLGVRTRDYAFFVNNLTPRPSLSGSSCAALTETPGLGGRPMPPSASPDPPKISVSWSPSGGRWPPSTSPRKGRTRSGG
ncbi:hypothetical protein BZL30_4085 [Mycobacterium kansasii]|uniref:Mycothiol-dependent maleylpyruvate isomerase metal-binding domain-containing protein n=1 Tax=Mycobacterium kansasii TaxID=1768 RepID=A0A1V3XA24_MYCKA|nr:hypothetical protein BZL30_4085 [Mycobacterium kansasii]